MVKRRFMLTVDVEALPIRAASAHVNTVIYGLKDDKYHGIGKMMDIADKHDIKMVFFVDFAECAIYGDEIIEVGKYIISRGHDMQVHCHYDLLNELVGKPVWGKDNDNYYSWYKNDDDSKKIIDYITDKYIQSACKPPIAYRGGEYRFGVSFLKLLKEKGYLMDLSYNCIRPEILPMNRQFEYENGLFEIPCSILENKIPVNFNHKRFMPKSRDEFDKAINEYQKCFDDYYDYYGDTAICSMLMHSWSFMYDEENFKTTGHMDHPNEILEEFFDYFLSKFKNKMDFITCTQAIDKMKNESLKIVDFESVFSPRATNFKTKITAIPNTILEKKGDREFVIWGKGFLESQAFEAVDLNNELNTAFYISKDADSKRMHRGKPVYRYDEVAISPKTHYVFVIAKPEFNEIRDTLKNLGYKERQDYFDIQWNASQGKGKDGTKKISEYKCNICGSNEIEIYNSDVFRRCSNCGSVERTRTALKVLTEHMNIDFANVDILHCSPSMAERLMFKNLAAKPTTLDVRPECKVDIYADICNMPQVASDSFDLVFANCVLNHVYDDDLALAEINRVLKKDATALFYVMPADEGFKTTYDSDPSGWYGEENLKKYKVGTFRHYGEVDFIQKLEKYFSKVVCYEKYDEMTTYPVKWFKCIK